MLSVIVLLLTAEETKGAWLIMLNHDSCFVIVFSAFLSANAATLLAA